MPSKDSRQEIGGHIKKSLKKFPIEKNQPLFTGEILARTSDVLDGLGFTPENTLFGSSFCPDEINNAEG